MAGRAAEKRQHGWVTVAKPLDRGAVRVKVKFPWLDCKVGAAFPDAVLQNDAGRYEFKDAIITGCAPDSVSLNYAKVTVRGSRCSTRTTTRKRQFPFMPSSRCRRSGRKR